MLDPMLTLLTAAVVANTSALVFIAALVCIALVVAAALGRISWVQALIATVAILVVLILLGGVDFD